MINKIICLSGLILISSCGGGGSDGEIVNSNAINQQPVVALLPASQSNSILTTYLNAANQAKYKNYSIASTSNTWTYATSVGARVTGNGVLIAANSQSFKLEVDRFLSEFIAKAGEIGLTYVLDPITLKNELFTYQQNDISYILNNIGGSTVDATYIYNAYLNAALKLST